MGIPEIPRTWRLRTSQFLWKSTTPQSEAEAPQHLHVARSAQTARNRDSIAVLQVSPRGWGRGARTSWRRFSTNSGPEGQGQAGSLAAPGAARPASRRESRADLPYTRRTSVVCFADHVETPVSIERNQGGEGCSNGWHGSSFS